MKVSINFCHRKFIPSQWGYLSLSLTTIIFLTVYNVGIFIEFLPLENALISFMF